MYMSAQVIELCTHCEGTGKNGKGLRDTVSAAGFWEFGAAEPYNAGATPHKHKHGRVHCHEQIFTNPGKSCICMLDSQVCCAHGSCHKLMIRSSAAAKPAYTGGHA